MKAVWPKDDARMLAAIRAIKANGACQPAQGTLKAASQELADMGAEFQFVACSEFSLIAEGTAPGVRAVDTVDLLVRAIIDFYAGQGQ